MTNENDIKNVIEQVRGSGKTFAEFLAELFKDKFVEIYLGDSYEEISTEQISTSYPAIFCGKVVAAYRECLIISAAYVGADKKFHLGNMMFINERAIRALNEVDGQGIIQDMLLRSRESLLIKKTFE